MGLFSFITNKKKKRIKKILEEVVVEQAEVSDELDENSDLEEIDLKNFPPKEKKEYIDSLSENIATLEIKNKNIKSEYKAVSSYLSDIQLIDTMPEADHEKMVRLAKHVQNLTVDRKIYQTTESAISNSRYITMQHYEGEIKDAIIDMANDEQRVSMIKRDMRIIEAEKFSLRQDARDYASDLSLVNQIILIAFLALVSVVFVYLLTSFFKSDVNDMVFLLIILGVLLLFTAVLMISRKVKYNIKLTELKINKAIAVHNKLKIKYVNAVSWLEYKKDKYDVNSAYELGRLYELYLEAKKEKERYMKTASEINEAMDKIMSMLKNLNLYDYSIWQNEVRALADKREMVEIRHRLNTRRAKLREQLENNNKLIEQYENTIKLYSINYNLTK